MPLCGYLRAAVAAAGRLSGPGAGVPRPRTTRREVVGAGGDPRPSTSTCSPRGARRRPERRDHPAPDVPRRLAAPTTSLPRPARRGAGGARDRLRARLSGECRRRHRLPPGSHRRQPCAVLARSRGSAPSPATCWRAPPATGDTPLRSRTASSGNASWRRATAAERSLFMRNGHGHLRRDAWFGCSKPMASRRSSAFRACTRWSSIAACRRPGSATSRRATSRAPASWRTAMRGSPASRACASSSPARA